MRFPNRTESLKKDLKPENFLKLNNPNLLHPVLAFLVRDVLKLVNKLFYLPEAVGINEGIQFFRRSEFQLATPSENQGKSRKLNHPGINWNHRET